LQGGCAPIVELGDPPQPSAETSHSQRGRESVKGGSFGGPRGLVGGCQRRFAQMVGANWAAWGTVQKVSNLILNINVYMEDAESGKMKFARSVDIRGNTDESWRRGLDYLLRSYLLRKP
jgi:Protein of unknown function (DUF2380)